MTTVFSSKVAYDLTRTDLLLLTQPSSYPAPHYKQVLIESGGRKWPRRNFGLVRQRYFVLECKQHGGTREDAKLNWRDGSNSSDSDNSDSSLTGSLKRVSYTVDFLYFANEESYNISSDDPLGRFTITPTTIVEKSPISVLDQFQLNIRKSYTSNGSREKHEKVIFCVESEDLRDRWTEEIAKAIEFLRHLEKEDEGERAKNKSIIDKEEPIFDEEVAVEGIELTENEPKDAQLRDEYEDVILDDLESGEAIDETKGGGENQNDHKKDGQNNDDIDRKNSHADQLCTTKNQITQIEAELGKQLNPIAKRTLRRRRRLLKTKQRALSNWHILTFKWLISSLGRSGAMPSLKRFVKKIRSKISCRKRDEDLLKVCLTNAARSAVRFKHFPLLKYLIEVEKICPESPNTLGFTLIWFAVGPYGRTDGGLEIFEYLLEKGANPHSKNLMGQSCLFFVVINKEAVAIEFLDYLIRNHSFDPRIIDEFGCSLTHWAVYYDNLKVVEYLFAKGFNAHSRARWWKLLDIYDRLGLLSEAVIQTRNGWRSRGLMKYTADASPLTVAILHNNAEIAKFLMGLNSKSCGCEKRAALFMDNNHDLDMVATSWPELLPEVLNSFASNAGANDGVRTQGRLKSKPEGGFEEVSYSIADLIGPPTLAAEKTPLAILCRTENPEVFESPIIKLLISLKWSTFGKRRFVKQFLPYLLLVFSYWYGNINGKFAFRVVTYVISCMCLLFEEGSEMRHGRMLYLRSGWNYLSLPSYIAILYVGVSEDLIGGGRETEEANVTNQVLVAICSLALILRSLEFFSILSETSVFIITIFFMIKDIIMWAILFIIFLLTFATSFYLLLRFEEAEGFETFSASLFTVFKMSVGDFDTPFSDTIEIDAAATSLFVAYIFLVHLLYLNLLIAMMAKSYDKVVESADGRSTLALARALVVWEGTLSRKKRQACTERLVPPRGRVNKMILSSGLGFNLFQTKENMIVTLEHDYLTTVQKSTKDWRDYEREENASKGNAKEAEMEELAATMTTMKSTLEEMAVALASVPPMMITGADIQLMKSEVLRTLSKDLKMGNVDVRSYFKRGGQTTLTHPK